MVALALGLAAAGAGAQPARVAPSCDGYEYQQMPMNLEWAAAIYADEEPFDGVMVEEAIVDANGALTALAGSRIDRVRVWGYTLDFTDLATGAVHGGCSTDSGTPWNIHFYGAGPDAVTPGALLATRELPTSGFHFSTVGFNMGAPCSTPAAGCAGSGQWTFVFPPVPSSGVRWIGLQQQQGANAPDGHPCVQVLITEGNTSTYDDELFQRGSNGADVNRDLQMCVGTTSLATLDIDGNGVVQALTDGLLLIRYLFSLTGTALTSSAVGAGCTRCDPTTIKNFMDGLTDLHDFDGNGSRTALTDGLLFLRERFGLSDTALTSGVVGGGCTRCAGADIESYIMPLVQ
jgi:hypothetical protein